MSREKTKGDRIESDRYIRQSGVQGGKIIAEHLALGCLLIGIPFFIIGLFGLGSMVFGFGFPTNTAMIIAVLLLTLIGLLLIISGYTLYRVRHVKNT